MASWCLLVFLFSSWNSVVLFLYASLVKSVKSVQRKKTELFIWICRRWCFMSHSWTVAELRLNVWLSFLFSSAAVGAFDEVSFRFCQKQLRLSEMFFVWGSTSRKILTLCSLKVADKIWLCLGVIIIQEPANAFGLLQVLQKEKQFQQFNLIYNNKV